MPHSYPVSVGDPRALLSTADLAVDAWFAGLPAPAGAAAGVGDGPAYAPQDVGLSALFAADEPVNGEITQVIADGQFAVATVSVRNGTAVDVLGTCAFTAGQPGFDLGPDKRRFHEETLWADTAAVRGNLGVAGAGRRPFAVAEGDSVVADKLDVPTVEEHVTE